MKPIRVRPFLFVLTIAFCGLSGLSHRSVFAESWEKDTVLVSLKDGETAVRPAKGATVLYWNQERG